MNDFLNKIRMPEKSNSILNDFFSTFFVIIFGLFMGVFSKFLDCTASNYLPYIFQAFDITNFLGRFSIWIFFAVVISFYSRSPLKSALNVFLFFAAMLLGYFAYTNYIAGFFPKSYILIWVMFTAASPFLAFICWYGKGEGNIAIIIDGFISGMFLNLTFNWGVFYIDMPYFPEFIIYILSNILLFKDIKSFFKIFVISIFAAIIWKTFFPFIF